MAELGFLQGMHQENSITYCNSGMCDVKFTISGRNIPPHPFVPIFVQAVENLLNVPQAKWDRWLRRSQQTQDWLRAGPCTVAITGFPLPLTPELWLSPSPNQYVRYVLLLPQVPEWERCGLGKLLQRVPEHLRGYNERMGSTDLDEGAT